MGEPVTDRGYARPDSLSRDRRTGPADCDIRDLYRERARAMLQAIGTPNVLTAA